MLDPKAVANFFLKAAEEDGVGLSPMKLQKLVYYAHGWHAGATGEPLINEAVEAWPYGPVIPSLYHEFKKFGAGKIKGLATDFDGTDFTSVPPPTDDRIVRFLRSIWKNYGQFTGIRLSEMTHASDSPWDKTWRESNGMRGVDIPFETIREHFHAAVVRSKEKSQVS
jgi:uncharacterized phage-associated protein